MNEPILTCRNLTVGYETCRLCESIDFTLHAGEYLCVIGPEGIGKSALVSTIMGIEPPVEGEVILENGLKRTDIGCMPQEMELLGTSVVKDIVISGCIAGKRGLFVGKAEKERAMYNLERLGAADLAKRRIGELSGGQRQRVLLARALCAAKKLLILDEPMHGLDAMAKDEMFNVIADVSREGIAVLIVDAEALDGTVLHLSRQQLFCGPVEDYIRSIPGQFYFAGRII